MSCLCKRHRARKRGNNERCQPFRIDVADDPRLEINAQPLREKDAPSQESLRQDGDSRFGPVETTTYRVKALLLGYRHEEDKDFHLVLADPDNPDNTMIAEIPASDCERRCFRSKASEHAGHSRFAFRCARPPHQAPATTGTDYVARVGFFDIKHSNPQDGVAPNGIELHPVLGMRLSRAVKNLKEPTFVSLNLRKPKKPDQFGLFGQHRYAKSVTQNS